jgi:hypothetical protein
MSAIRITSTTCPSSIIAAEAGIDPEAKMHIIDATTKQGKKVAPIVYVYVVKGKTAYGTPLTPEVNAKAIEAGPERVLYERRRGG